MSDLGSDYEEEEQGPYLGVSISLYLVNQLVQSFQATHSQPF